MPGAVNQNEGGHRRPTAIGRVDATYDAGTVLSSAVFTHSPQLRTLIGAAGTAEKCQKTVVSNCSRQTLFDQIVSAREQCRRHFEAERLCRLKIDHHFEFSRLLDR